MRLTSVIVEQEVEEGNEDQEDVKSNRKGLIGGGCKCRLFDVIIIFFLDQPVNLSYSIEDNGEKGVIVGSIDDDFKFLRKSFDLMLMIDQFDDTSKPSISRPVHKK